MSRVKPMTHMGQLDTFISRGGGSAVISATVALPEPLARPLSERRGVAGRQGDRLLLQERLQSLGPKLAPDARFLEATERSGKVDGHGGIQHVGTGAHLPGHTEPAIVIARPDRTAQSVVG